MGGVYKTAISLRFHGDDLHPDELSRALGGQPTVGVEKGGIWLTPKGREVVATSGMWLLKTGEAAPGNVDGQIAVLFAGLSEDFPIWREYARRYGGNIFAGVFLSQSNEGLSLSPVTLNAIGMRGLELGLDIYNGRDGVDDVTGADTV